MHHPYPDPQVLPSPHSRAHQHHASADEKASLLDRYHGSRTCWSAAMKDEYLRDFFAALALDGIMGKMASTTMPAVTRDALAKLAYQMADAMLTARDKVEVMQ